MRTLLLTGLIFFFGVNLLSAQSISWSGLEVENYEEVYVLLDDLNPDALDIGLTENRIRSRVNVRLRQVGLKPTTDRAEALYINIIVVGGAFSIVISFNRAVFFYKGDDLYIKGPARVYTQGSTGTHGRDPDYIISALDGLLDQFLSDYLDAND